MSRLPGYHVEPRKGTAEEADDYCRKGNQSKEEWKTLGKKGPNWGKEAVLHTWGVPVFRRGTKELDNVVKMLQEGSSLRDIALLAPKTYMRCHKGLIAMKAVMVEPRTTAPNVVVLHGSTGVGKSRQARELIPEPRYVWQPQCGQWFDGYTGETNVIFEEFRGQLPFGMMLSLLDRYDAKVQFKGGMVEFAATNICITSPYHPKDWYTSEKLTTTDSLDQLLRRITSIEEVHRGNLGTFLSLFFLL